MRADAHAEGNCLGIGGWAGFPGRDWCRTELRWFSVQFTINDFPASWNLQEACTSDRTNRLEGHRIIAGLETLAQTVLLVMTRDFLAHRCGPCYLPVESDNAPTVGALNKIFSNKWPMAYFILNFHHWSTQCNFQAEATHVKGIDNDYADTLSRAITIEELLQEGWRPELQFNFSLQEILSPQPGRLHPAGASERAPPRLQRFTSWPYRQQP